MDEINRLKERVNTLIDALEDASMEFYDPKQWRGTLSLDPESLDREPIPKCTE